NSTGEPVYRKVAVVENFFDIIYNVHVDLEGRPGKHAGQKRTYRTITETYAFLPREAVTRFLLGCTECQKHPRSPSPASVLPTPSPSPTLPPLQPAAAAPPATPRPPQEAPPPPPPLPDGPRQSLAAVDHSPAPPAGRSGSPKKETPLKTSAPEPKRSSNPLDVSNLTSRDPPRSPAKKRHLNNLSRTGPRRRGGCSRRPGTSITPCPSPPPT
ncbi:vegetative cell wall protein gp1, partial [Anoplophora glabripennis]|uniref:vegetative cell wall protein gp1 n=1 Tax=Anoplophora glabripennis TaxID=217634 RepID=UPI00087476B8